MRWPSLLLTLLIPSVLSYKILVYNVKFAHSHSNYLGNMADILVEAGHNVTTLISEILPPVKDGTTKSTIIRVSPDPDARKIQEWMLSGDIDMFETSVTNPIMSAFVSFTMSRSFVPQCRRLLAEKELIRRLQEEKYDLYIVENFDMCGAAFGHLVGPKATIMSSTTILNVGQHLDAGVPLSMSFNPSGYTSSLSVHSFFDRLRNLYHFGLERIFFGFSTIFINQLFRKEFGPDYPSISEITSNAAFVFTNSEPLISVAAPTLTRVVDVGGLGAKPAQKLDTKWEEIMTKRNATVLISFGSMAKSSLMKATTKQSILKMVSRFPNTTFVWKYETPEDEFATNEAAQLDNLVLSPWTPQHDLLNHDGMALFITHGGMGSVQETTLSGVPALLIPLFGDQPRNALTIEYNGLGKVYDKFDLPDDAKLTAAVRELLNDEGYRRNAKRTAQMIAEKPFSSKEQLLKYVNFAAKFGPSKSLRPHSLDMSFIAYHNLDVIIFLVGVTLFFVYCTLLCTRWLLCSKKLKTE